MLPILLALTLLTNPTPQTTPPAPPTSAPAPLTNPAFIDVAAQVGVVSESAPRTQLIDVDGDGWLDLVIVGSPLRILFSRPAQNGGAGRVFVDGTASTGLNDREHSMLLWGDVNGDGKLDVVSVVTQNVAQYKKDPQTYAVYLGDGKGHFRRQRHSGLEQQKHVATMGAVLTDLDLDGKLDLAFGNQYDTEDSLDAQPMRVFQGNGKGNFADVTAEWGFPTRTVEPGAAHAPRPLYGLTAADLDNDGYPELLGAAYGRQWNTMWKRSAAAPFYDDVAANYGIDGDSLRSGVYPEGIRASPKVKDGREDELPFRTGGNNFALVAGDFDGDGALDLFCAAITHWWAGDSSDFSCLLVNTLKTRKVPYFERQLDILDTPDPETGRKDRPGRGLARDHTGQKPRSWNQGDIEAHWADFDNDGLLDLLICESDYPENHLRLFLQNPDHTFHEVDRAIGLNWPNCPSVALGDYNGDGKIDIVATGTRTRWPEARPKAAVAFFENHLAPDTNGYLMLRLIGNGTTANTSTIGARVTLTTSDGHTQTREVSGPYGHWAAQTEPGVVHFGLGTATPTRVTIIWPDAKRTTTTLNAPARNSFPTIRQENAP